MNRSRSRSGTAHRSPTRTSRGSGRRIALGLLAAALLGAVLLPQPVASQEDQGAAIELSAATGLDPDGAVITVTGSGFDPDAHTGTRPPLSGRASGVYVVFGAFDEPWAPSDGASSSSRRVVTQKWALPRESYDYLNPNGTSPDIILLEDDGTFVTDLEVSEVDDPGQLAVATYPGSGAVNAEQEVLVPISFGDVPTTTSTTTTTTTTTSTTTTTVPATTTTAPVTTTTTLPTSTTTPTTTTTAPVTTTTTAPTTTTASTTTTVPATTTTVVGTPQPSGSATGTGAAGQQLRVAPSQGLDPSGQSLVVTGSGYDGSVGVYVALCVDQGDNAAPSPCVGGVDLEGTGSSSVWVSSNPPAYAADLAKPFGPGGTFEVELTVAASDEFVDCFDPDTSCVIATRADHTATQDRSADVKVPVFFHGQEVPGPGDPGTGTGGGGDDPVVSLGSSTVTAGSALSVSGSGFLAGEQVQVWLLSDPVLLGVETAAGDGSVSATVTVPEDVQAGIHHVELRGLTSGTTVRSESLTVLEPLGGGSAQPVAAVSAGGGVNPSTSGSSPSALAFTGSSIAIAGLALVLLALGVASRFMSTRIGRTAGEGTR